MRALQGLAPPLLSIWHARFFRLFVLVMIYLVTNHRTSLKPATATFISKAPTRLRHTRPAFLSVTPSANFHLRPLGCDRRGHSFVVSSDAVSDLAAADVAQKQQNRSCSGLHGLAIQQIISPLAALRFPLKQAHGRNNAKFAAAKVAARQQSSRTVLEAQNKTADALSSCARQPLRPRVLCTGLGVVNGVGLGIESFWKNIISGKNVIDKVTRFDPTGMACQIACEVPDSLFDPAAYFKDPKEVRRNDRYTHFGVAAARLAMEDAGLGADGPGLQRDRFGVVVGSGVGGIQWMEQELKVLLDKGPRRVSPYLIPAMIANTASAVIAIDMNAQGPNHGAVSACATSGHATATALRYLQSGDADIVLCGGAEASITPLSFAGFNALRAMAPGFNDDPKRASRPFDKKRAGFIMGEGAGIMVLETEEHAVRRGANKVYGEIAGCGATCDAFHITAPATDGCGLARCLEKAIEEAGVQKSDIGYINAHGTSTLMNDRIETLAFKKVFGEEGARKLLISSTKSMTGHCLGATGGIEACIGAKVLETGVVPPTINQEEADPDCDLNYVPNKAYKSSTPFEAVLSDTLGFGGHNAALVIRRYRRNLEQG